MQKEKSISDIIASHKKEFTRGTISRLNMIPNVENNDGAIRLFIDMIRDYRKGSYKLLSLSTLLTLIGSLIYIISPIDVIPDSIFVVGALDDLAVVAFAIRTCYEEVCAYKLWLATRDLSVKEAEKIINRAMSYFDEK